MKQLTIDLEVGTVRATMTGGGTYEYPLASTEAFRAVSQAWLRAGWDTKYVYSFTWLGRPIIQLPEDILRLQEVICQLQPDLIIETGIAHGGSLVFCASLCKLLGKGRVVGVDIDIRPPNRAAIEAHPLSGLISLIEGDSTALEVVHRVQTEVKAGETVLVLLDSCHSRAHVLAELEAYSVLVSPGSYIVAMDGIMEDLVDAPRTKPDWSWNNPQQAVREFLSRHPDFVLDEPPFLFNEGMITERITYWPSAFVRRL